VVNLRGKIIPVIDLRLKFGMASTACTEKTCIIVMEIGEDTRKIQMGIIVDSVSEVLNIKQGEIAATPDFGAAMETDYILGVAKTEGGVKILLDIDYVLRDRDFQNIFRAA
jgi:purine-binding chemotaxis protein CheW